MPTLAFVTFAIRFSILALCAGQVYYISLKYFKYEVSSSVSFQLGENITSVPAITVCSFDFLRVDKEYYTLKMEDDPEYKPEPFRPSLDEDLANRFRALPLCINKTTISCYEECKALGFNTKELALEPSDFKCVFYYRGFLPHELIVNVTVADSLTTDQLFYDVFFWHGRFCYTLNNRIPTMDRSNTNDIWRANLLLEQTRAFILMEENNGKSWGKTVPIELYASSPIDPFESTFAMGSVKDLKLLEDPSLALDYRKVEETKLPSPYKTHCFDYGQVGFASQSECINNCILQHHLYVSVPVRNFFDKREEVSFNLRSHRELQECLQVLQSNKTESRRVLLSSNIWFHVEIYSDIYNLTSQCLTMVQYLKCKDVICSKPECKRRLYPLSVNTFYDPSTRFQVVLQTPKEYDISIHTDPAIVLTDFLIYVASAIAFWFGLDVISLSQGTIETTGNYFSWTSTKKLRQIKNEEKRKFRRKQILRRLANLVSAVEIAVKSYAKMTGNEALIPKQEPAPKHFSVKKVTWAIYFVIAACGMVFQLYHISSQYFAFDVKTQVSAGLEEVILLPIISLCFLSEEIFAYRKRPEKIGPTNGSTPKELILNSLDNFFSSQLHSHSIFFSCSDLNYKSYKFLRQGHVCYSIDTGDQSSVVHRQLLMKLRASTDLGDDDIPIGMFLSLRIPLDVNDFSQVNIIYASQVRPKGNDLSSVSSVGLVSHKIESSFYDSSLVRYQRYQMEKNMLLEAPSNTSDKIILSFEYTKLEQELMPWPYVTNCLDRSSRALKNRGECFEHCLNESVVKHFSSYPMEITLTKGTLPIVDHSLDPIYQRLKSKCKDECKQEDCKSVSFLPKELEAQPFYVEKSGATFNSTMFTRFQFFISDTPNIIVSCSPQIVFIDFITFVLGCPCFWFGVAPLPLLLQLLTKRANQFSTQKQPAQLPTVEECDARINVLDACFDHLKRTLKSIKFLELRRMRRIRSA